MKTLVLDTSSNLLYVGLLNGNKQSYLTRVGNNDNAAHLIAKIDELLVNENLTINDIDEIVVGVGPGSYTGSRVAVVVAKTLAYSKNITLKTISSLNLLSSGYSGLVNAAIDARRNHYFLGTYENGRTINSDTYLELNDLSNIVVLNNDTIKIDLFKVVDNAIIETNIHELEPNYLRKTEAENNYDQKNDN